MNFQIILPSGFYSVVENKYTLLSFSEEPLKVFFNSEKTNSLTTEIVNDVPWATIEGKYLPVLSKTISEKTESGTIFTKSKVFFSTIVFLKHQTQIKQIHLF